MKIFQVMESAEGIVIVQIEGDRSLTVDNPEYHTSFASAKRETVTRLTQRIADSKQQLKDLRARKAF